MFGMKAHLNDTRLLVPRSRSSAKVKVKYLRHVSQKIGVSGALMFHKHILLLNVNPFNHTSILVQKSLQATFFSHSVAHPS